MNGPDAAGLLSPADQVHGIAKIAGVVVGVKGRSKVRQARQKRDGRLADQFPESLTRMMHQGPVRFRQGVSKRMKRSFGAPSLPPAAAFDRPHRLLADRA